MVVCVFLPVVYVRAKLLNKYRGIVKDIRTKQKFLELRAQEKSFRTIEKEMGISRRTLAAWESEYKEEIANLKAIELEAVQERYGLTTKAKLERYGAELQRVTEELQRRDLAGVPTPKLYDIMIKLYARIDEMCQAPILRDNEESEDDEEMRRKNETVINETVTNSTRANDIIEELNEINFNRSSTTGEPLSADSDQGPRRERLADEFIKIAYDVSPTAREILRKEAEKTALGL